MNLIALVRRPSATLKDGERTHVDRTLINFARAQEQHRHYVDALREMGATIVEVPVAPALPDAVFIEDTALVLDSLAVIARPGAMRRRPEVPAVTAALSHYRHLLNPPPAVTFDGGDILVIGQTIYIGLTVRTNQAAIDFLTTLLRPYHYEVVAVPVSGCLHLKTAVTALSTRTVLLNPQWVPHELFVRHAQICIDPAEPMAANALRIGHHLFMSASYPLTAKRVEGHGHQPRLLDISEFQLAGGGLTCLSILFRTSGPS